MSKTALVLSAFCLMQTASFAADYRYEVKVFVGSVDSASTPVSNLKLRAIPYGTTMLSYSEPDTTVDGWATLRFKSPQSDAAVHYEVVESPDGEPWFVKGHGVFPGGGRSQLPHRPNAAPNTTPQLDLTGYTSGQSAAVAQQELSSGRTEMVGSALAFALTVPPGGQGGADQTPADPLAADEALAKLFQTSEGQARNLISDWKAKIAASADEDKLDEKALVALMDSRLIEAGDLAAQANNLPPDQKKEKLGALPDTGRLVETLYQLTNVAIDNKETFQSATADTKLEQLKASLENKRPPRDGRSPASAFDAGRLEKFSKAAREMAAQQ